MLLRLFVVLSLFVAAEKRRKPAEYEKGVVGIMVGWGDHMTGESDHDHAFQVLDSAVCQIAREVASCDDMMIFVVVHTAVHRDNAMRVLQSEGVDMARVQFIGYAARDRDYSSAWLRDYGPQFVYVDDMPTFVQADYDWEGYSRVTDSLFPDYLGTLLAYPVTHLNFHHSGGNLVSTSDGHGFMTDVLWDENPGIDRPVAARDIKEQMGFHDLTIFRGVGHAVDSTEHIDMLLLPVSNSGFIVTQFQPFLPGYFETETIATELLMRGFTVYRTPSVNDGHHGIGGFHYTYTNAVILPQKVLIPAYGGFMGFHDQEAKEVFERAFPSRTIVQIDVSDLPQYEGALHCLTAHIFTPKATGPYIRLVSPSGTRFNVGDTMLIEWILVTQHGDEEGSAPPVQVELELIFDKGPLGIAVIEEGKDVRSVTWTIPEVSCAPCYVRATATTPTGVWADTSRKPIAIQQVLLPPRASPEIPINQLDIFDLPLHGQSAILAELSEQIHQAQDALVQRRQHGYPRPTNE